ncbi:MAG: hypothetical protein H6705_16610 [Myxococcales bacterium]|nr:hypothetical protein [Myxococcales bacterium]
MTRPLCLLTLALALAGCCEGGDGLCIDLLDAPTAAGAGRRRRTPRTQAAVARTAAVLG